ncbi:D-hexose-6-phosphate mutarotase [Hydrogenophaga sp. A37]|uniref:D-hexose-6-phosphate mutarotase n=1 Tax=Hydrogenophaga sp. A37 TaxID=1945864 RepID=UPI0009878B2C|nr:D-hexose-6-phosphate mutarotase [Hydrogenophaga sp. A37]OOG79276.1 D-hexose-6-phosphate mutarotase [Hydrogenophaga sp. A37]
MTLEDLNAEHAIADQLRFVAGPGGLPLIQVRNVHAEAAVCVHGAQVLSYRPVGASADVLFVSERAHFQAGKAIRGGVPICWPWFGADPQGLGRPSHGVARTRRWSVRGTATTPGGATQITLGLMDTPETLAIWPHTFQLTMTITVGATLRLALTTLNTGEAPFQITQALHSYFAVGGIAQTSVTGLDGCPYIDKAAGGVVKPPTGCAVTFAAEVDRIYTGAPAELALVDGARQRTVRIGAEGSHTAVVWNPGATLAASMADLQDDEYLRFACVETANAADEVITLPPGGEHRLVAAIALSPMG